MPLAHVSALRETSVLIAAMIGTMMLGEPFGRKRIASAVIVAGGVACCTCRDRNPAASFP
ncbi:MAG: hypothetical protein R3D03_13445 [Geminicoccaceae bacterium]